MGAEIGGTTMTGFDLLPIGESSVLELAGYFAQWRRAQARNSECRPTTISNPQRVENVNYLRWLLVDNPAREDGDELGICVRDSNGAISGVMLTLPSYFVWSEKRLRGLCSGSFYVNTEARMQGFFIFKKYLHSGGHDFYFATTCGPNSGALWSKLRGRAVPNSDSTFVLPYRAESLLDSFAENRHLHPVLATPLRSAGRVASALAGVMRKTTATWRVAPSRDWERLARLASQHRDPERITNERSARFLEWRYSRDLADHRKEIHVFWDHHGNEGWFALAFGLTGGGRKYRAAELLDLVWPSRTIEFREILAILVAQTVAKSDALYIRERSDLQPFGLRQFAIRLRLPSPRCYVATAARNGGLDPSLFDFAAADGDSCA